MEYVYGATIAFAILLAISVIISSMLIIVIPKILLVMQTMGSIYMLYLAYQIYNIGGTKLNAEQTITFRGGFLMQFVNPKVVVFTMAVIPSFVMPYDTSTAGLSLAVAAVTIIGFLAFITWVLFGAIFKVFLQRYQKAVNLIMGLFLVYSAILISGVVDIFKG
jgi:threonine/homoserine/homoserine lactone efflux protein